MIIGPLAWIGIRPFHVQAGRILLYLVYFLAGAGVGAWGIDRSAFRSDGTLARRWWGWLAMGLLSFIVFITMVAVVTAGDRTIAGEAAFVFCCGAIVIGLQYLLLGSSLGPGVKGTVVFLVTLILSWGTAVAVRRIPIIAKVIYAFSCRIIFGRCRAMPRDPGIARPPLKEGMVWINL